MFIQNAVGETLKFWCSSKTFIWRFSFSAFNKMQSHILIERLGSCFNIPNQLPMMIFFVNRQMSKTLVTNTGSPQGCVPSPHLFILLQSRRSSQKKRFSDDTVLLSLFSGAETDHGPALPEVIKWCDDKLP